MDDITPRSFFKAHEHWNEDGLRFLREVEQALKTIMKEYEEGGFSLREMVGAINDATIACSSSMRISNAL